MPPRRRRRSGRVDPRRPDGVVGGALGMTVEHVFAPNPLPRRPKEANNRAYRAGNPGNID